MSGLFVHWNSEKKHSGPIGLHFSSAKTDTKYIASSVEPEPKFFPNPHDYKIIRYRRIDSFLILLVKYPNCINYEGNKILVFKNCLINDICKQSFIEPHFFEDVRYHSPIARFVPTDEGWEMTVVFCKIMTNKIK